MATATTTKAAATAVTMTTMQRQFLQARDVSVPLVVIRTPDPAVLVQGLARYVMTLSQTPAPVVQWDAVSGFLGVNQSGGELVKTFGAVVQRNPVQALDQMIQKLPPAGCLFGLNMHDFYKDNMFRQVLWNCRDQFKQNGRTLVITQPFGGVPIELEHDIYVLDEPLPGHAELRAIVEAQVEAAAKNGVPRLDPAGLDRAAAALAGLSGFAAEQAVVLSLRRSGLDFDALRERHRQMIQNTKGLHVYRGGETFADVGGLSGFKVFADQLIAGRYKFGSVFWIDEIEKAFGGLRGDLTGITQDYLGVLLSYMADQRVPGVLLMGHPGTGKSYLSKALGNVAGVPTIRADLGAMHGSLVGESQSALRQALKVVTAVSQGRPLFVATCNSVAILPPEFVNRFKWRFFVDLPDATEKASIWPIHLKRFELDDKQARPTDLDWNGREIEQCCETAYQLRISLKDAAQYIVPVAQSSAEAIGQRRNEASDRYLSASKPGPYTTQQKTEVQVGTRSVKIGDDSTWVAPAGSGGKAN